VVWEYLSGTRANPQWKGLRVEDDTRDLTESGAVTSLMPSDFSRLQRHTFEQRMYWIRAHLWAPELNPSGVRTGDALSANLSNTVYAPGPKLQGVALHTVQARQGMTLRDEVLGSSNGNSGQVFASFRRPILAGQQLEVLEIGSERLTGVIDRIWTPWAEIADFHGSTPQDRHYVIDRQNGEIRFGDGQAGMIPPPGSRNVRLAAYRTGGGTGGNLAGDSIKSLVTPVRYVDKVTHFIPAQGGAGSETMASLLARAPRALRHRGRAVTEEDYEDLAKLASADVARALCVPLADLSREPAKEVQYGLNDDPGKVSLIIVPESADAKPLPSQTLLRRVQSYLREHASVNASIFVVGPLYIKVNVTVHATLESLSLENRVRLQVQEALAAFLHPLTGRGGMGWPFGRLPQHSDLHRLLRQVPGIDHIRTLDIDFEVELAPEACQSPVEDSEVACVKRTGRFLVHSGQHDLKPQPVSI
jgi:predicted phage baseplate assembly protein